MWKATSTGISTRIRCTCGKRLGLSGNPRRRMTSQAVAESKPSPPPPPPPPPSAGAPPPKKGGVFWKLLGLTTVGAGGFVGYCWYDPGFRKQVEDNVPYSKEAFDYIFPYLPDSPSPSEKKKLELPFFTDKEAANEESQEKVKDVKKTQQKQPAEEVKEPPPVVKKDPVSEKQRQKEELERRLKEKASEEAAENAALEVILENATETLVERHRLAIDAQNKVIETTKKHTQLLKKAMDDTSDILDKDTQWSSVADAFEARLQAVATAEKLVYNERQNLEKLKHAIENGKQNKITKRNKTLIPAQETMNKLNTELNKISSQVAKAEVEGKVMVKYKDLIDKGKKQFQKELESIMPDVKIGSRKGQKLTEEELNSLIAHAHRRIEQLQKTLAEQQAMEQQRMHGAMEQQREEDEKLTEQRVIQEGERLWGDFAVEKEKWDADARVEYERELRQQLARQAAAHSDHLREVLRVQEKELEHQFEKEMHMKILEERQVFQTEVAGWIARLKGIEAAVDGRAESEKVAHRAQELWLACVALNGSIRLGQQGNTWEEQLKPLATEVVAITEAAGSHPYINTVVRAIPDDALSRGVWSEDNLRERFTRVKRVCKRVALIDETGGSLFKYFVSYIQSFLIFDAVYAKSSSDEVDMDKLNTFGILAHADYWLEKGDFEQGVRFMCQLQGESRRVAADWIQEAKLLLETRQAAYALTAFASASGLGTIF